MVHRPIRLLAACPNVIYHLIHTWIWGGYTSRGVMQKWRVLRGGWKYHGSYKAMIRVKVNYFRLLAWSNERIFFGEGQFQNWRMNVHTHPISKRQNSWYIDFLSTRMKSSAIFYKWRRHWFLLILRKLCLLCCAKISQ